jgi:hypothetical protein
MVVKIHFETLSPGLHAKLDASYRTHNNCVLNVKKRHGNGSGASLLEDAVGKCRPVLAGRNK